MIIEIYIHHEMEELEKVKVINLLKLAVLKVFALQVN